MMIVLMLSILACNKEDVIELSDDNSYIVSLDPYVLNAKDTAKLKINIKSEEIGFPIDIYACPPFMGGTITLATGVLPLFQFGNQAMYGSKASIFLNCKDTTVTIKFVPKKICNREGEKINFNVYINGNNTKNSHYDKNLGVQCASSYYTMEFDAPTINFFNPVASNITSNCFNLKAEDIKLWSGVYAKITYGICYSENSNPTVDNDNITEISSNYIYKSACLSDISSLISGLVPNTTYYLRPFVNNGKLTYGEEVQIKTLDEDYLKEEYLQIGISYEADDNLTISMNSIKRNVKDSYTEYIINYTLTNNTTDLEIPEGNFTIFSLSGDEKKRQYGSFSNLLPSESKTRSYKFKVLNSTKYHLIEYNTEFFTDQPSSSKLKWGLTTIK